MSKLIKEKLLHRFSKETVYITLEEITKDEQLYCLNIWDSEEECLNCKLSLDISENLEDIISDLLTVCEKVVVEINHTFKR